MLGRGRDLAFEMSSELGWGGRVLRGIRGHSGLLIAFLGMVFKILSLMLHPSSLVLVPS